MKAMMIIGICIFLVGSFASAACAQLQNPEVFEKESAKQRMMFIDSGKEFCTYSWEYSKKVEGQKTLITILGKGVWDKTIQWTEKSLVEISSNGVRTLSWEKNSTGDEQMNWKMKYDWDSKVVHYSYEDRATGKKKNKDIKLEENVLAGDSMYIALRGFPFEKGEGTKYEGQIINSNGMVLSGSIIHHGEEKLKTVFGEVEAYKLELKPHGFIGVVSPQMFMWFTKAKPHLWLRQDGRDYAIHKPRTKNVLAEYEPKSAIK